MKITFPHIGDAHLIGRIFFTEIGIDIITPHANTEKGLEKGSEVSPDEICLPFKLMLSNLMEAYKLGADTVIMPATMGPCRLGEYGELLKSILDRKGYSFQWVLLDSPNSIGKQELLRRLANVVSGSNKSLPGILTALIRTYKIIEKLEKLEQKAHILAGYEKKKGECKKVLTSCRRDLAQASGISQALKIIRHHRCQLGEITFDFNKKPLHILVTGEIFSMIEPFANHHIEELLMDMSVSFEKRVTLRWWIRRTILRSTNLKGSINLKKKRLPYDIGGYAKETVEDGELCVEKGYDGVIQLFPVGCMPEIVAKAVFSKMMKEREVSILTVIYDEMGGEAGYITRIEAFIDMLNRRKSLEQKKKREIYNRKVKGKTHVLSGH
ncbi:MAG: acyl-CoA dehydratase activase-related protein [Eubacteriales bacterium]|nr:acyl-CoA dehydratase activase-related protein [Eubacteriales bacterium]MDD4121974.1 acyl-CoA dehydratase activase-related protein [Eubacteriales bacterium]